MLRQLNILPLFIACFLILGHSVFPHTHRPTNGNEFVLAFESLNCDSGVFGLLHDIFAQDLGENHLENYNKTQQDLPAFIFIAQAFLHTFLEFHEFNEEENTIFYIFSSPKPYAEFILKDAPLRAPPRI